MKRLISVLLVLSLTVFSGCTPFFVLPNETIKAPRTTGEYENIQKALIAAVGEDITMKYPKCNGTSAAYTTGDIDGDGEGEILAFYQPASVTSTHINVLKSFDGVWKSVADIEPVGSNLERVELCDLDKDGGLEILTGWSVYDSKNYELAIFSNKNGAVTQRTREKYTDFVLSDFDSDGVKEIVLLILNTNDKTSQMQFYKLTTHELRLEAAAVLNGTVTSYGEIYESVPNDGQVTYFVDGYMGNGPVITEGVKYENKKLTNLLYDEMEPQVSPAYRPLEIASKYQDSEVLIPFVKNMAGDTDGTAELVGDYIFDWMTYNGEEFEKVYTSYYCSDGGYEIKFDEGWEETLVCSYLGATKTLIFYYYQSQNVPAQEIFRITEVPLIDGTNEILNPENYSDMVKIKTGEVSAFLVSTVPNNRLNITTEKLRQSFILREN